MTISRWNYSFPDGINSFPRELFFSRWEDIVINTNPNGFRRPLSWSINDQLVLELDSITTPYCLDLKGSKGFQQLVPTSWTKLKNGYRQWWLCPRCRRRCGVLYFDNGFACSLCIKPAYECQNGSRTDYLARKIRDLSVRVLGLLDGYGDDVIGGINSLPKTSHLSGSRQLANCQKIEKLQKHSTLIIKL